MSYSIVHFPETNEVEVVPQLWLENDDRGQLRCWWPPFKTLKKVTEAVETQSPVQMDTWLIYNARTLGQYGKIIV